MATPTPWQQHDPEYCPLEIYGNLEGLMENGQIHGTKICDVESESDARLIVKAVNHHEKLLIACKESLALLKVANFRQCHNEYDHIRSLEKLIGKVERS